MKCVLDHIIVRPDPEQEKIGSISVPEAYRKPTLSGEIVEVGPGRWLENGKRAAMGVKKGDRILFDEASGILITIKGVPHRIMREPDVLVVE